MGADEDRAVHAAKGGDAGLLEDRRHAGKFFRLIARVRRAGEVIERQHGMGLAAAEIGLQPDHRIAAFAGEARDRRDQDAAQALGRVGDAEEGGRVRVFFAALPLVHAR